MKKYVGFIMLFGICVSAQIDLVEDIRLDSNEKYESQEGETNSSNKNTPTHEVPKTYTVSEVSEMAVYLGCEEFKDRKQKSQQCLSQKLSEVLMIELEPI